MFHLSISSSLIPVHLQFLCTSVTYGGTQMGTILGLPLAGLLCKSSTFGGWPSVFYIYGTLGIIWFGCWTALCFNDPDSHPRISGLIRKPILGPCMLIRWIWPLPTPIHLPLRKPSVWTCKVRQRISISCHVCPSVGRSLRHANVLTIQPAHILACLALSFFFSSHLSWRAAVHQRVTGKGDSTADPTDSVETNFYIRCAAGARRLELQLWWFT